jgi:hypothetical protein
VRDRNRAEILAHISSYLNGELAATEYDAIERHCRECESCAAVVAGLLHPVGLCREAGSAPLRKSYGTARRTASESCSRISDRADCYFVAGLYPIALSTRSISGRESLRIVSRSLLPTGTMIIPSGPTLFMKTSDPRTPPMSASVRPGP